MLVNHFCNISLGLFEEISGGIFVHGLYQPKKTSSSKERSQVNISTCPNRVEHRCLKYHPWNLLWNQSATHLHGSHSLRYVFGSQDLPDPSDWWVVGDRDRISSHFSGWTSWTSTFWTHQPSLAVWVFPRCWPKQWTCDLAWAAGDTSKSSKWKGNFNREHADELVDCRIEPTIFYLRGNILSPRNPRRMLNIKPTILRECTFLGAVKSTTTF